ncbi:MAG: polyprenyl synthetase family protein [Candidatus Hodarchaeales archaeon]|jgi:geranylgeranyl diphosphate synthase type I
MPTNPMKILAEKGQSIREPMKRILKIGTTPDFEEVVHWQVECGGKRLRPALTMLFAEAVGKKNDQDPAILAAAAGIELIHNFSLIYDDIIDQGNLRRGKATTRAEYGDEMAILAGIQHREAVDHAARETGMKYYPQVLEIYSKAISEMVDGERLDVLFEQKSRPYTYYKKHKYDLVTEQDYLKMINGKTASLLRGACAAGALVGGGTEKQIEAAVEFGTSVGYAFQIMDDYLDLFGDEKLGKNIGKDIIERKLGSFPLIKALQNLPSEKQELLLETLKGDLPDEERVSKVMDLINQGNGRDLAREAAKEYVAKARNALEMSFPDSNTKGILAKLADYVVSRLY